MTGVILLALLWLYLPFLKTLFAEWGTNDDYSHGYFIPFLSVYFIYAIRDQLKNIKIEHILQVLQFDYLFLYQN